MVTSSTTVNYVSILLHTVTCYLVVIYRMSHSLSNPAIFNKFTTNENIATKLEQEYLRCVRNEKECVCSAPNSCGVECPGGA